jgi:hypothetical protein
MCGFSHCLLYSFGKSPEAGQVGQGWEAISEISGSTSQPQTYAIIIL